MAIITCPNCGAKNRVEDKGDGVVPVCGRCKAQLITGASAGNGSAPVDVTDASFASEVLAVTEKPTLVDCWAEWCGPCHMIAPTITQLAAEANGRWKVAKLNVDENPHIAGQFGISSIPTLLIFKGGKLVDRVVGVQQKAAIERKLASHAG